MPIDYKEYHPKWSLISRLIRFKRAGNRCEACGLVNQSIIKRLGRGDWRTPTETEWDAYKVLLKKHGKSSKALKLAGLTRVILTVAHLDHNKQNNRFGNLKAWCQSCHLWHDREHHAKNRKFGREWKKNQLGLFKFLLAGFLMLSSCVAREFYTAPEGEVVSVDRDLVCVTYPVLSGKGGRVYNCYFFERGHLYSIGDKYPNFDKHEKSLSYEIR